MEYTDNFNKARAFAAKLDKKCGAMEVSMARAVLLAYGSKQLMSKTARSKIKTMYAQQSGKVPTIQPAIYEEVVDLAAKMARWGEKESIQALLCLMPEDSDIPPEENGDNCPICGAELAFEGDQEIQDDGTLVSWHCPRCGATGTQSNDIKFAEHLDVCDRDGNKITL